MLIAIISAIASLMVAITSLIAVLINSKNTSQTTESIERLKNQFAQSNRSIDILDSELKATLQSLRDSIQAIQNLRDEIRRLRLDKEIAVQTGVFENIHNAAKAVIDCYSVSQTSFSEIEKEIFHTSKNIALQCQSIATRNLLDTRKSSKTIDPMIYGEFDDLQMKLLDAQRSLWDCRAERLLGLSQASVIKSDAK